MFAGWHVVGEPGRVAGHRCHVVTRGQGLAQELAADPPVAAMMVSFMVSPWFEQVSGGWRWLSPGAPADCAGMR